MAQLQAFFKLETKYGTGQVTKEHFMDYAPCLTVWDQHV